MKVFSALTEAIRSVDLDPTSFNHALALVKEAKDRGAGFFFIGNGGSAAIASHMAVDFLKAGQMRAQCFNDGAMLTCLGNDLGYEHVFDTPLAAHIDSGDVLFAISSSGRSPSILNAAKIARKLACVITLSGFDQSNPLRALGNVNFYVPSDRYGIVEVCHLAICHALLDAVVDAK